MDKELLYNNSHIVDMTAAGAIKKIEDDAYGKKRAYDTFGVLLRTASLAGFTVRELVLENNKTGVIYRKNEDSEQKDRRTHTVCEQPEKE